MQTQDTGQVASGAQSSPRSASKSAPYSTNTSWLLSSFDEITRIDVDGMVRRWGSISSHSSLKVTLFGESVTLKASRPSISAMTNSSSTSTTAPRSTCTERPVFSTALTDRGDLVSFQPFKRLMASSDESMFCLFLAVDGLKAAVAVALRLAWNIDRPLGNLRTIVESRKCTSDAGKAPGAENGPTEALLLQSGGGRGRIKTKPRSVSR